MDTFKSFANNYDVVSSSVIDLLAHWLRAPVKIKNPSKHSTHPGFISGFNEDVSNTALRNVVCCRVFFC